MVFTVKIKKAKRVRQLRKEKSLMTYREEFPDYDPATMPEIPARWIDQSWHNDAAPIFLTPSGLSVLVDYADPVEHETRGKRFIAFNPSSNRTLFEADDWSEMVAFVMNYAP